MQDGSASKDACCKAWWPEFNFQDLHHKRREVSQVLRCLLDFPHHTHIQVCARLKIWIFRYVIYLKLIFSFRLHNRDYEFIVLITQMSQRKLEQLVQNCVVSYLTLKHVAFSGAVRDQLYILEFCFKKTREKTQVPNLLRK